MDERFAHKIGRLHRVAGALPAEQRASDEAKPAIDNGDRQIVRSPVTLLSEIEKKSEGMFHGCPDREESSMLEGTSFLGWLRRRLSANQEDAIWPARDAFRLSACHG